ARQLRPLRGGHRASSQPDHDGRDDPDDGDLPRTHGHRPADRRDDLRHEGDLLRQGAGLHLPGRRRQPGAAHRHPVPAGVLRRGQELHLRVQGRGVRAVPAAVQPAAGARGQHPGGRAAGELPRRADQPGALRGHQGRLPGGRRGRGPGARRGRLPGPAVQPAQRRPQRDHRRGGGPGAGGAAADLQHHPAGRVQPPQRDQHHAAGRRLALVHPAAVHPGGRTRRAHRRAARDRRPGAHQGALRRPHAGGADQGRDHPAGRLVGDRVHRTGHRGRGRGPRRGGRLRDPAALRPPV
ncbi:MAG: Assymetric_cell_division_FstX, partial [uncultured Blastococcus sp.]